ncbi:MAG: NAD(P)/FAD-dependent oxidoreductase [Candidatus Omnitrophica bacterium]|nr:NAD(P)/FAD-dependent oxidoreductase [Candidatus Omnitrophota bacterium]
MHAYDIAIIGAGPAGMMAGIRAGQLKKRVVLIERNSAIGKKILITGKGRCNVTNIAPLDEFIEKFGKQGQFLRSAFTAFSNQGLIEFFESHGLKLKIERQGRVFPETDMADSVIQVLKESLKEYNVRIFYNTRVKDITKEGEYFQLFLESGGNLLAKKVIIATGGMSFKTTGSTGDGFIIAKKLGHTIVPLIPGLVPLKTKEIWVKEAQGLTLKNIRLVFECDKKRITSDIGEMLFTHFGISGPLVLDLSSQIVTLLKSGSNVALYIDLKPGMTNDEIETRLLNESKAQGSKNLKNILKGYLPSGLVDIFTGLLNLKGDKQMSQLTQNERHSIMRFLKVLPLTITGSLPIEEAMVTCGGISTKEINPRTMESRLAPGLYFAGEIIDASASSGGYNLQQAFSTGYLAGDSAAKTII